MPPDWRDSRRPQERDAASFWDMLERARDVVTWIDGKTEAEFVSDPVIRYAIERCLTIIGEAARRVTDEGRMACPSLPWRQIIGLRNMLAHDYQEINPSRVWLVATRDIPLLIDELRVVVEATPE
jgi:uncharacterized protein with HEPN domain